MDTFLTLHEYKNILNLDRLKCDLKSVYAADFPKQTSSIQEVAEITKELEFKQALAEGTKYV